MWKFFSIDGPIVNGINRWTSLVWLNILTTFCCVPIITAGASLTAMHCVVFRISKGEELAVTKVFFHAFKDNFKESTLILGVYFVLLGLLVCGCGIILINGWKLQTITWAFFGILVTMMLLLVNWTFILQSRYDNDPINIIKNAIIVGLIYLQYSLIFAVTMAIPILLLIYAMKILPVTLAFWFTAPAYVQAKLYGNVFDRLEEMDRQMQKAKQMADTQQANHNEKD